MLEDSGPVWSQVPGSLSSLNLAGQGLFQTIPPPEHFRNRPFPLGADEAYRLELAIFGRVKFTNLLGRTFALFMP